MSEVKNIGVEVNVLNEMEVQNMSEDTTTLGAFLFGYVGAHIQKSIQENQDAQTASSMYSTFDAANYRMRVESLLIQALEKSGQFSKVQIVNSKSKISDLDAILEVDVLQWGVRANHVDKADEKIMEVGHLVEYKLMQPDRGKSLWQERQLFVSGHPRTLSEYQKIPEILMNDIESSLTRYCLLIVNQLIY